MTKNSSFQVREVHNAPKKALKLTVVLFLDIVQFTKRNNSLCIWLFYGEYIFRDKYISQRNSENNHVTSKLEFL